MVYWKRPWSIENIYSLAGFSPERLPFSLPASITTSVDLRQRVAAIYEHLQSGCRIEYGLEPWSNSKATQLIRHPMQLMAEKVGTCVDLALLFCRSCQEADLLPWLVVLEGHVLAMVSVSYSYSEASQAMKGRAGDADLFKNQVCTELTPISKAIPDRFVAVECTGLARGKMLLGGSEFSTLLNFEGAVDRATKILTEAATGKGPKFRGVVDFEVAFGRKNLQREIEQGDVPWDWLARESLKVLREHLSKTPLANWAKPNDNFPNSLSLEIVGRREEELAAGLELIDWMRREGVRSAVIAGSGAVGKSSFVQKLIQHADPREVIVLVDLKGFSSAAQALVSQIQGPIGPGQMDSLMKFQPKNVLGNKSAAQVASSGPVTFLIDGLNEVPSEADRQTILSILKMFLFDNVKAQVVVTTREFPADWITQWATAPPRITDGPIVKVEFLPIDLQYAASVSKSPGSFPEAVSAFFLDRGETPLRFLRAQLGISELELQALSKVAYELYAQGKVSFSRDEFEAKAKQSTSSARLWDACTSRGIIRAIGNQFAFENQIFHDHLVGLCLATADRKDLPWTAEIFDNATLNKASSDALSCALKELPDAKKGDAFLERVNDWNWRHAFKCLSVALIETPPNQRKWNPEVELAFAALLEEKCNDPILKTRTDAGRLKATTGKVRNETAREHGATFGWQRKWNAIHGLKPDTRPLNDEEVALIVDCNSIVGWTIANLLRRFHPRSGHPLDDRAQAFLRGVFDARDRAEDGAVRWRIVHALGAFPTKRNSDMLLAALASDTYRWVRYGSARSLIEHAIFLSTAERTALLEQICKICIDSTTRPEDAAVFELAETSLYRGADAQWPKDVLPMLEKIGGVFLRDEEKRDPEKVAKKEEKKARWDELLRVLKEEQALWNPTAEKEKAT